MREIKFRAWDKENNEFITDYDTGNYSPIQFYEDGDFEVFQLDLVDSIVNGEYDQSENVSSFKENIEIMQFTGLKDKNGKEIYESDVVKHPYGFGNGAAFVSYWPPIWKLESKDGTCEEIGFNEVEVIGNIYQNPELINL